MKLRNFLAVTLLGTFVLGSSQIVSAQNDGYSQQAEVSQSGENTKATSSTQPAPETPARELIKDLNQRSNRIEKSSPNELNRSYVDGYMAGLRDGSLYDITYRRFAAGYLRGYIKWGTVNWGGLDDEVLPPPLEINKQPSVSPAWDGELDQRLERIEKLELDNWNIGYVNGYTVGTIDRYLGDEPFRKFSAGYVQGFTEGFAIWGWPDLTAPPTINSQAKNKINTLVQSVKNGNKCREDLRERVGIIKKSLQPRPFVPSYDDGYEVGRLAFRLNYDSFLPTVQSLLQHKKYSDFASGYLKGYEDERLYPTYGD